MSATTRSIRYAGQTRAHLNVPFNEAKGVCKGPDELADAGPAPVLPQLLHKRRRRGCWARGHDGRGQNLAGHECEPGAV